MALLAVKGHLDMQDLSQVERRVKGLVVKGQCVQIIVHQVEDMV